MAIKLKTIFVSICILDVYLGILKIDCIFIEGMAIHGWSYFIFEKFIARLPYSNSSFGVGTDLKYSQLIFTPKKTFVFLHPASTPFLVNFVYFFIFSKIPYRYFFALYNHQKATVEEWAMKCFLRNAEKMIEVSVIVNLNISVVSLNQEWELKLYLLSSVIWASYLFLLIEENDVSAVVYIYLWIINLIIVNFVKQRFLLQQWDMNLIFIYIDFLFYLLFF